MFGESNNFRGLYKIGGITAIIFVVYSLATIILVLVIGVTPESPLEIFELFQENKLVGLLRLDILTLLIIPFYYPLFLSISIGIRKSGMSEAALGALLAFAGVTLILATPSVFSFLTLSNKYAAAESVAQQEQLLAAGEALLAADMWHGSGAVIGGVLTLIAALLFSIVMLRSKDFSKATAIVGIATHALDLLHVLIGIINSQIGTIFMAVAGPLYLVWFPLLARDLFRLRRKASNHKELTV